MALRILSYNILAGGEDRIPLIANVIQKQKPDVVALLEARSRSNAEALAKHLLACEIVIEGDAEAASDHLPIWAEFV